MQVDCSKRSDDHKSPMTTKEKCIVEQLLANCSPTVQRIVNAENKFTIPPPFGEEESDKEDNDAEEELQGKISFIQHMHVDSAQLRINQSELSTNNDIDHESNELTVFQEISIPFESEGDVGEEDLLSLKQPHPNNAVNNVSTHYYTCKHWLTGFYCTGCQL